MSENGALMVMSMLYMVSLGGFTYFVLQSFRSAAGEYAVAYSESTARQMEDLFLFIPARRVLELSAASSALCFLFAFFMVTGGGRGLENPEGRIGGHEETPLDAVQ
jgi:hypothetical protein